MKPVLILTDVIENKGDMMYSIEIVGTVDGKLIKAISMPIALELVEAHHQVMVMRAAVADLLDHAVFKSKGEYDTMVLAQGANVLDIASLFDIKQTTEFNHAMADLPNGVSIIAELLW